MTEQQSTDLRWLDAAARLATPVLGTGAGPVSGALIVDPPRQMLLGRAITPPGGTPSAEVLAIRDARSLARGRTLYVNLEPASDYGTRTSVTAAIAAAGIARVVTGALDPDRAHAGEGLKALANAGIDAAHLDHPPSVALNEGYAMRVAHGRPFITLKLTLSADGMVGHARRGAPNPLGAEALRWLERERAAADAVLSGMARAEIEDNDLRVHLAGLGNRPPLRLVLRGSRDPDLSAELFTLSAGSPLIIVGVPDQLPLPMLKSEMVTIEGEAGRPDLRRLLALLSGRGVDRLFVEAGAALAMSFLVAGLVDRLHLVDAAAPVGVEGVPAPDPISLAARMAGANLAEVDRRALGEDKVRTFERRPVPASQTATTQTSAA